MRIFLTGATGYIGLHLVEELLAHGHDVTALVRSPSKLGPLLGRPGLHVVVGALDDAHLWREGFVARALARSEVCLHTALVWGAPEDDHKLLDVVATAQLFEAAGRAGVSRCVFLSSTAVHRPFRPLMAEDDALTPPDVYGATKAAGELFLRAACATHAMHGVVVRAGPVVGPPAFPGASFRCDPRFARLIENARSGLPLDPEDTMPTRQLIGVDTLARALRLAATTAPQSSPPNRRPPCGQRKDRASRRGAGVFRGEGQSPPRPKQPTPSPGPRAAKTTSPRRDANTPAPSRSRAAHPQRNRDPKPWGAGERRVSVPRGVQSPLPGPTQVNPSKTGNPSGVSAPRGVQSPLPGPTQVNPSKTGNPSGVSVPRRVQSPLPGPTQVNPSKTGNPSGVSVPPSPRRQPPPHLVSAYGFNTFLK